MPVRYGDLCGVAGRRSPPVRDEIRNGDIRLMPDGRDHGDPGGVDGPGHPLVVEGPEVLQRAAAPSRDDQIGDLMAVGVADGRGDLRRGLRALDQDRQQQDLRHRPALAQNADHVVHRRARRGGDDGDPSGEGRQRLLVRLIEEPFGIKALLELFKGHLEIADAVGHDRGAGELIRAVPGIDPETSAGKDAHPVFRTEAKLRRAASEHDAPQAALLILQGEIVVTRGVDLIVRQFPLHAEVPEAELGFQKVPDRFVHLADGQRETAVLSAHVSGAGFSSRRKLPSRPLMKAPAWGES